MTSWSPGTVPFRGLGSPAASAFASTHALPFAKESPAYDICGDDASSLAIRLELPGDERDWSSSGTSEELDGSRMKLDRRWYSLDIRRMKGMLSCGRSIICGASIRHRSDLHGQQAITDKATYLMQVPVLTQPGMLEESIGSRPMLRFLREALRQEVLKLGRAPGRQRRHRILNDAVHARHGIMLMVGRLASEQLDDRAGKRPDV